MKDIYKQFYELVKEYYDDLDTLAAKLQADYNGDETFKQSEEDRLSIIFILDVIDDIEIYGYSSLLEAAEEKGNTITESAFDDEYELWENLVKYGIATDEEIRLVTNINGLNIEALNDILFTRTGYRDWEQFIEE